MGQILHRFFLILILPTFVGCSASSGGDGGSVSAASSNDWIPSPGSTLTSNITASATLKALPQNKDSSPLYVAQQVYGLVARLTSFENNNRIELKAFNHFQSLKEDIYIIVVSDTPIVCGGDLGKRFPFSQGVLVAQAITESELLGAPLDESHFKHGWMYSYILGSHKKSYRPFSQTRFITVDSLIGDTVTVTATLIGADGDMEEDHVELSGTFNLVLCP